MTAATLADWSTPQPFALPDLGPGLDGERRVDLELALFGSRWHVISEAARHGRVLVVRLS